MTTRNIYGFLAIFIAACLLLQLACSRRGHRVDTSSEKSSSQKSSSEMLSLSASSDEAAKSPPRTETTPIRADTLGCLSCHLGIEDIREPGSAMLDQIKALGKQYGDPGGCVICHGGQPRAFTAGEAHKGTPQGMPETGPRAFYRDPGSIWIAEQTCGQPGCHVGYPYRLARALMNTEAGKIQGNLHTWGIAQVRDHKVPWGNYDISDTDGQTPMAGTEAYKEYMKELISRYPDQFPVELSQIPQPTVEEIENDPMLAGFTYQRQQCQRCHVGVRGREKRGDYRGMGCSACHILYSNEGYYEGNDPTISKDEPGHLLSHRIHGTREAGAGIPVETCNSCHNRGKRIGVTYQGLMEFEYGSPYDSAGQKQPKLHTKRYLFISDDLHHQIESRPGNPTGGLLCQDCHTSIDIHGDGNIFGTTLAQVEIECQDCHGTPDKFPWELPLGYSEEFARDLPEKARGLGSKPPAESSQFGTLYDKKDGYLLSARGNPLGNVVKDGNTVILHSATGNDFQIPVLKQIARDNTWKSPDAMVAMSSITAHADNLECYACHASWVPQCYGCHVQVNYGNDARGNPHRDVDWVASGSSRTADGQTAESILGMPGLMSPGKVFETRSYLRWEEPVLGVNGEGRVTPLMPGCQVVYTVIGRDGTPVTVNRIARSPDEAADIGQDHVPLAIDMAPVQPHSAQRKARSCESCHDNPKALGYGISGGVFQGRYAESIVEDLIDQKTGEVIPRRHQIQIQRIEGLNFDWSTIIDQNGNQVQTVGTHWPLSRALNREQREGINRTGLCMGCHREMRNPQLWSRWATAGRLDKNAHIEMMNKLFRAASEAK
ncbi:MAG: cytochrome C [Proteobacteria bacterium]|nr:cytochrome C [Pseudomonadota bacterium]